MKQHIYATEKGASAQQFGVMRVVTSLLVVLLTAVEVYSYRTNDRPIIGILSQELSPTVSGIYGNHSSYIAASYVKFLEGAGGRVIPVWINQRKAYYRRLVKKVNGLLFPGGATYFTNSGGYAKAGKILYDLAVDLNNKGDHFPILGTCLGSQLLLYVAAGQKEHRCVCSASNIMLPLQFTSDFNKSRLFGDAPDNVLTILKTENVTSNFHNRCVTLKNLTDFGLSEDWHVLSVNNDLNDLEFISSFESREYPFYGVMFHPEKNGYEWKSNKNIPHSTDAVVAMQYFANFIVNEARKNFHHFPSEDSEQSALIYGYDATYTGNRLVFEQLYFFDN